MACNCSLDSTRYTSRRTIPTMAYQIGYALFYEDLREYVEVVLESPLDKEEMTWLTTACYHNLKDIIKFTYCLETLYQQRNNLRTHPPRFYKGIQDFEAMVQKLISHRKEYWEKHIDILHFLNNVRMSFLPPPPPPYPRNDSESSSSRDQRGNDVIPSSHQDEPDSTSKEPPAKSRRLANIRRRLTPLKIKTRAPPPPYTIPQRRPPTPMGAAPQDGDQSEENWDC